MASATPTATKSSATMSEVKDRLHKERAWTSLCAMAMELEEKDIIHKESAWDDWHESYRISLTVPKDDTIIDYHLDKGILDNIRMKRTSWFYEEREKVASEGLPRSQLASERDSSESWTRLLDWKNNVVRAYRFDELPPYTAISHVWAHEMFPVACRESPSQSHGMRQLDLFLSMRSPVWPEYDFLWIDSWCINQDDEEDKIRQIPLMAEIYKTAVVVLLVVPENIGFWQMEFDHEIEVLGDTIALCRQFGLDSDVVKACIKDSKVGHAIIEATRMISTLAGLSINQRIWTAQEYMLAQKIYWIGLDGLDFWVEPTTICAILDLFNSLFQYSTQNLQWAQRLRDFHVLNKLKYSRSDPTEAICLSQTRGSTLEEDQIYGLMGATTVILNVKKQQNWSMSRIWNAWFSKAISEGHYQWISAPVLKSTRLENGSRNCAVPSFAGRCEAARFIDHKSRDWLRPPAMIENAILTTGRFMGVIPDLTFVGTFPRMTSELTQLMNCIQTSKETSRIVAGLSSGKLPRSAVSHFSNLIQPMLDWSDTFRDGTTDEERVPLTIHAIQSVPTVVDLESHANLYAGGRTYIGTLTSLHTKTEVLMVSDDTVLQGPLFAFDLEPYDEANNENLWRSLTVVQGLPLGGAEGETCHKVGTTYPVLIADPSIDIDLAAKYNIHIAKLEAWQVKLGGNTCAWCRTLEEIETVKTEEMVELEKDGITS